MDEPTNHLDVETAQALGHALKSFTGAILFISHDIGLIQSTATHIGAISDGKLLHSKVFPLTCLNPNPCFAPLQKKTRRVRNPFADQKKRKNQIKKIKSEIEQIESQIEQHEHEIEEIENRLMVSDMAIDETLRLTQAHQTAQAELTAAIETWEQLSNTLDDFNLFELDALIPFRIGIDKIRVCTLYHCILSTNAYRPNRLTRPTQQSQTGK